MLICANEFVKSSILCGMKGISFYFVTVFIVNCSFGDFVMLILIFQVSIPYFEGYDIQRTRPFFFNSNLIALFWISGQGWGYRNKRKRFRRSLNPIGYRDRLCPSKSESLYPLSVRFGKFLPLLFSYHHHHHTFNCNSTICLV